MDRHIVFDRRCLEEYDTTSLSINKFDVTADVMDNDTVQLSIITYVSNSRKTSGEMEIETKAYNMNTNLLMADGKISIGKMGKDKTLPPAELILILTTGSGLPTPPAGKVRRIRDMMLSSMDRDLSGLKVMWDNNRLVFRYTTVIMVVIKNSFL